MTAEELLIASMHEHRRTARLLQLLAVGAKIDLTHFQIAANFEKADDIEKYLIESGYVLDNDPPT